MMRSLIRFAGIAVLVGGVPWGQAYAAPQEDAFMRVWGLHRQMATDPDAVIKACRDAA